MNKLALSFFLVIFSIVDVCAQDDRFEFPEVIHEFENAMIIIKDKNPFTFEVNQKCVGINVLYNIEKKDKKYILTKSSGYIEIDNKCFVNTDLEIKIKTDKKEIKKSYKLLPPIVEERNWGC